MARLLLLIGLPGSGKSTLAKELMQKCPERRLISTDAIRAQLYGDETVQGCWLNVWREVGHQFYQAVQQIEAGKASEAIYDATNVVRKQRRQAIALARASGFTYITGLWLNTPLWLCVQRNQERDRQVPKEIIYRMNRRLCGAPPSRQEGMDELVELDNGESGMGFCREHQPNGNGETVGALPCAYPMQSGIRNEEWEEKFGDCGLKVL